MWVHITVIFSLALLCPLYAWLRMKSGAEKEDCHKCSHKQGCDKRIYY